MAMILAAGRGERMRPLTDTTPKPLLFVGQHRLIEWQIISLVRAGVERIVINYAWLGEQFPVALGDGARYGCQLMYSPETTALETAGGIAKALPLLVHHSCAAQPFIVVSGDIYTDYDYRRLPQDLNSHSAHLVLVDNPTYHRAGDMSLIDGQISHDSLHQNKLTYGNIGVFNPAIFLNLKHEALKLFPWLYTQGTIQGEHYVGNWHNVGTPSQLNDLNRLHNNAVLSNSH
jgi:N-acetyl-alpha-D-muramate 1-phosphate uridylyltransferase